ncbi:MAG: N-6 DNA methylase [bacterium]|nr:N-6 DNA methylase [bacterium]
MFGVDNCFDIVIGNPPYVQIQKFSGQQIQKDWEEQNYETFAKTGDIYCLFYERGHDLLNSKGILTYISSNKWMRANYGQKMRKYLLNKVNIKQLIDFGDSPIFSEATTYTNILTFSKDRSGTKPKVWDVSKSYKADTTLTTMLSEKNMGVGDFREDAFIIATREQMLLKKRIETIGTPLKMWDVSINYGIKTGLNEAFIIDGKKKNELIAKEPKNTAIIKPILRGRDIKKYSTTFSDLWLLFIPWHFPLHNDKTVIGSSQEAESQFQQEYPVLYNHMLNYKDKLEIRNKAETGIRYEWYALQRCAASYHQEFGKEKIVYAEIVRDSAFCYDRNKFYPEVTTFILTGANIKFLTAMLNSRLLTYAFKTFYAGGDLRGNTFRYKKVFLEKLPVPQIPKESQQPFEYLVDYIMPAKKEDLKLQAAFFEELIDGMVFELYFAEELKRVDKEILKYMTDLKPLKNDMTPEEKLVVLQSEFDRLYDPYHPVRNNLETLDSIKEIRTVMEI